MTQGRCILPALLCLALVGVRLVHLSADSPWGVTTRSVALYVDEGYKTLGPRNLLLFGSEKWYPDDDYGTWMKASPLTQLPFYAAFRALGPSVESARLVTVAWFALLLVGFVAAMRRRYSALLLCGGLLALGLQSTLFFYSRVALLEVPIAVCVYLLVLSFAVLDDARWLWRALLSLAVLVAVTFTIKRSALVYLLPVLLAALAAPVIRRGGLRAPAFRAGLAGLGAVVAVLLVITRRTWLHRIALSPMGVLDRALPSPLIEDAPFAVLLGVLCMVHGLLCAPRLYLADPYRAALVSIALLSSATLALFAYDPLRYFVPILPAYLLLTLEWLHLRGWNDRPPARLSPRAAAAALLLVVYLLFQAGGVVSRVLVATLGADGRSGAIPSRGLAYGIFLLVALLATLALARWRSRLAARPVLLGAVALLVCAFALRNAYQVGRFLAAPSYRAAEIRRALAERVPAGASIAGDWAPFFALGTDLKALYVNDQFNLSKLDRIRPDYLLYCETRNSDLALDSIRATRGMSLGPALYRSEYIEREVVLYPLLYRDAAPARSDSR